MTFDKGDITATFFTDYYTNWAVKQGKYTEDRVLGGYDNIYVNRKADKFMAVHYAALFEPKMEKEYRAKVTFDAPSSPEYLSYHSLYGMIYEHFRDVSEVEPLKDYEFVYSWRKENKRLTFPFIRCLYGHLGFQVVEGDDPEDIVYLEFKK